MLGETAAGRSCAGPAVAHYGTIWTRPRSEQFPLPAPGTACRSSTPSHINTSRPGVNRKLARVYCGGRHIYWSVVTAGKYQIIG